MRQVLIAGVFLLALALAACGPNASTAPVVDAYDVSKMDMKPPPAEVSSKRHTGPFASGNALNTDAAIKPLDPSPVKEIRLDTTHKIIEIAQRAAARGRTMVFCAIEGRYDAAKVKKAARQVRGVDGSTVRVSSELSAVSLALDTKAQSPQAAVSALQAEAPKGTKFKILKVIAP